MAFSHTVTEAKDRSSIVRGDVGFVSGTWNSGGTTSGSVITGGSTILAHGVEVGSATFGGTARNYPGSATVLSQKNNPDEGTIRMHSMAASNQLTGEWWAIVSV